MGTLAAPSSKVPRCYYTRWGGEESDSGKEDLIILENLYSEVSRQSERVKV